MKVLILPIMVAVAWILSIQSVLIRPQPKVNSVINHHADDLAISEENNSDYHILKEKFGQGHRPDPILLLDKLWPGRCFLRQSPDGMHHRPMAAAYVMRELDRGPLFSESRPQYEIFIPFTPHERADYFDRQSIGQVAFGNHIRYSGTLAKESIDIRPMTRLPDGSRAVGGSLRAFQQYLLLAMGHRESPSMLCYFPNVMATPASFL